MSTLTFPNQLPRSIVTMLFSLFLLATSSVQAQFNFNQYGLQGENLSNPTSLDFGPDDRLYVSQQNGTINIYTVQRVDNAGTISYQVTATETIDLIKNEVPNHNDDGTTNSTQQRQVTGIMVVGTATNPIIYVTSSDWRIAVGNDSGLDTNSGVITRLTWNGSSWDKVDIVRGFPRCEENHSINGMDLDQNTNILYVMIGGSTNKGAPGNNFSGTPEYWFSGALVAVDLNVIDTMPVYTDLRTNTAFVYDLPTLNDPTRADIDNTSPDFPYEPGHPLYNATIDPGDPFGGNNGYNQAFEEPNGPVYVYSPGYRNAYDIVLTENGRLYTSDNGPNSGWGGLPIVRDANDNVVGTLGSTLPVGHYITNEFNETGSQGHGDALSFISGPGYFGGHPAAIRAFPSRAGVIIYEEQGNGNWVEIDSTGFGDLLTGVTGYFNPSFSIGDFPDDPSQATYTANLSSRPGFIDIINSSTNGICEYTATNNFNGALAGNIFTASYSGGINRYELNAAGDGYVTKNANFFAGFGSQPLDVIAQGDAEVFPGTIWAATYGANNITVFEPADFGACPQPGDIDYVGTDDSDGDGFSNDDEVNLGFDHCNGGNFPPDADGDLIADALDPDDDNDGVNDVVDAFALDPDNGLTTELPIIYPFWNNDPGTGLFGLGFTGLMTNGVDDWSSQFDIDYMSFGGAAGKAGLDSVPQNDAFQAQNDQLYAFQFGVNRDVNSPDFTIHTQVESPYFLVNGSSSTPIDFQSMGMYIGTGDQDNYLKIVIAANGGQGGIQVLLEDGGIATSNTIYGPATVGNLLASNAGIDLYLTVFPSTNTAQAYVSSDGGTTITPLGSPVTLPASFLDPNDNQGLAVGIISTSNGSSTPFSTSWDFINITEEVGNVLAVLNDSLNFGSQVLNSSPTAQDLILRNDGGPASPVITVDTLIFNDPEFSTTASFPIVLTPGSQINVPVLFNPTILGSKTVTVTIEHDGTNDPLLATVFGEVTDPAVPIFRVNAGGPLIPAIDGQIDWEADQSTNNSPYLINPGSNNTNGFPVNSFDPSVDQATTPVAIFNTERWDAISDANGEMQWEFPVNNGIYEVRLYLANGFGGTDGPGERVFSIGIEGTTVFTNVDLSAEYGHQVGGMKTYTVAITDSTINIEFIHDVENPLINGIEILGASSAPIPPIIVDSIANQTSFEGDGPNLTVVASGGDPAENFTYAAAGLPSGLDIEPTQGLIFGTVDTTAANGGPNNDGVHPVTITVSKPSSTPVDVNFTWTILEPAANGTIVYRINCGGPVLADPVKDWDADQSASNANGSAATGTPSQFINAADGDFTFGANMTGANTTNAPDDLFDTERFSSTPNPNNMKWDFPVSNGYYTVNLYFGETWTGINGPGIRLFDIEIEGNLAEDDFDQYVEAGNAIQVPIVKTYQVNVFDGNLDIDFIQVTQNPNIKGIEIISGSGGGGIPDQWTNVTNSSEHIPRHENSFVQAGDHFYIFGGREQPEVVEEYDYINDAWTTKSGQAPLPFNHFQAVEYQGLIWVIGAFKTQQCCAEEPADHVYMYDPVADLWIQGPEIPAGRRRGSAGLVLHNDKFYVLGGNTLGHQGGYVPWLDEFDPQTGTWTILPDAPRARDHFHAVTEGDNLYAVGGRQSGGPGGTFEPVLPEVDVYDFNTGTWSTLPASSNFPTPRAASCVVNFNGKIVVAGGEGNSQAYANTDEFDPQTGTWTALAPLNNARHGTQAIVSGDGIWVTAGSPNIGGGTQNNMEVYGIDNPTGTPIDPSEFTLPDSLAFAANSADSIQIQLQNGNQGIIIDTLAITGPDSADFGITAGDVSRFLIPADSSSLLTIQFSDTLNDQIAYLEIFHSGDQIDTVILTAPLPASLPPGVVLHRVNVGGPQVAAADASSPVWGGDQGNLADGNASPFLVSSPNGNIFNGGNAQAHPGPIIMTDPSIPAGAPADVFNTERYDTSPNAPSVKYSLPVPVGQQVEVRLLIAELFGQITGPGQRSFNIAVEDSVYPALTEIDPYAIAGPKGAFARSVVVTSDGSIEVELLHGAIENPALKGIEIVAVGPTSNNPPVVVNPGNQTNTEGDIVSLQLSADDGDSNTQGVIFSAANLPPSLNLDPITGLISGTIDEPTPGPGNLYVESGGLVIIEVEDQYTPAPGAWDLDTTNGTVFLVGTSNHFGSIGGQTLSYDIQINTTGVYRMHMKSAFSGTNSTEENDSWIKFDNTPDVHFFCVQGGNLTGTQEFVNILGGGTTSKTIYYPAGNAENRPDHGNENPGSNGFFKFYRSGSGGNKWDGQTIDNNNFPVYVYFPNPGVYTLQLSERSAGHKVDRLAIAHLEDIGTNEPTGILDGAATQASSGSLVGGAAANSPYSVQIIATDNGVPSLSDTVDFIWTVNPQPTLSNPTVLGAELTSEVTNGSGLNIQLRTTGFTLPNSGIDIGTVNSANVKLFEDLSNVEVTGTTVYLSHDGQELVLAASGLNYSTTYRFEVEAGVQDSAGVGLTPFVYTFSTTTDPGALPASVEFQSVKVVNDQNTPAYTSLTFGPDDKLYALNDVGEIHRWEVNPDGTLKNKEVLNSLQTANGNNPRLAISLIFDPAATANNLIAWVSHSTPGNGGVPDWGGKISKLSGDSLETVEDIIINLPRSSRDHATNTLKFGPDGALYVLQGNNSEMGAPDASYANRDERMLSTALLRIDQNLITTPPLDVQTADGGSYDPFGAGAPVTLYATGLRNGYDMVWHSNGELYVPVNGSVGGADPNTPSTPANLANVPTRIDGPYIGGSVTGLTAVSNSTDDFMHRVVQGGYYGHPNPSRGEYVLNGGNPTGAVDPAEMSLYPLGTLPDQNYRDPGYNFGSSQVPTGVIEYQSSAFGGALQGKILVAMYQAGTGIVAMTPGGALQDVIAIENGLNGTANLANPLDLVENPATGDIYVTEYQSAEITLLKPAIAGTATLSGNITMQGHGGNQSTDLEVTLYTPGTSTVVATYNTTSNSLGDFAITGVPTGTYDVMVKPARNLSRMLTNLTPGGSPASFGECPAGDANGDNVVSGLDFSILVTTFNIGAGGANYDGRADFNGDGVVSGLDFSLLVSNFNTAGDEPQ